MMKRFFAIIIFLFLLYFVGNTDALEINISPYTWYEINTMGGTTLIIEPPTMLVGLANYQARAFWEYSVSEIVSKFENIDSALITINNIGWTHTVLLHTYEADAVPSSGDWSNWNISDTWQNKVLYGWDDPFQRDPSNVFDITEGLSIAVENGYDYLGIMVLAPSASGTLNTFCEVESNAVITIDGTEFPSNQPPIADAGPNVSISSENQNTIIIQGTASDTDSDPIAYRWFEGGTELSSWQVVVNGKAYLNLSTVPFFDPGQHTLTLEVDDGTDTVADDMILTVDNSAPHAAPSGGGVYEINTEVILGGSVSDFDGDTLYYKWMDGTNVLHSGSIDCIKEGVPVAIATYSIWNLGLGAHTIKLQVDDGVNEPVSSDIMVEIVDTGVPTLAPVCNQLILWPPNHRMVDIIIEANASDSSGLSVTLNAEITCDEPDDGLGDGDLAPDWTQPIINQETGTIELQLRAERSGSGDGREYTIAITCTDLSGNSSTANVNIIVTHDKKK